MTEDEKQAEKQAVEAVLHLLMDGEPIGLTETLLVENVTDARKLLHQAAIMLAELGAMIPGNYSLTIIADVLHRVSCEKTAHQTGQEEPKSWSSELPFH